ncbi:MAG: beta-galactosidase [Oscillospiraceae bacterium]|nr:beta-galactosidase [Oscillospiraceae bacterium]
MRIKTLLTSARFAKQGQPLEVVALPHTWNAFDGQDGGNDYWRGIGTYEIDLPNPTKGKKQYIEIQGANHVATVYCNGRELGTHKGGFSTFRYDLTPAMKASGNILTVVVSNAVSDIYPQTADFTFYGGLYRDVNFIEVAPAHFDLLMDGTEAVFVTPHCSGKTRLDLFPLNADGCTVAVELKDAGGNTVGAAAADAEAHNVIIIDVKNPHLWNGMADPYCYSAVATIAKDGEVVDTVTVTYGYRSFRVDAATGFYLNGKNIPLRGVSRHQDRLDKGWAVAKADHEEDIALIKALGANTIRLAHYQHDQYFYDLCDKTGFALWAEIPFISKFIPSEEAYENTISQMTELVAQNYNHPSIFFWGISNEILIGTDNEPLRKNLRDLNQLAKCMDPSRLTTIAQVSSTPMDSEHNYITDVVSYNHYFGWYGGDVAQNGPWFDAYHKLNPDIPLGVSEYGVENITKWHSATPMNHDYSEEYASYYHHEMLKTFENRPYLWATHVWNCFDFAADARNEGGVVGRNNKGLISYDRKLKKDAFFLYKAYWTSEPMIHVAGRRWIDRAPEERNITVYTNCDEVTLIVNGAEMATAKAVDHAVVFENVALRDGENTVTAVSGGISDTITLNGVAAHNEAYTLPDIAAAMAVGNWFDEVADNEDTEEIIVVDGCFSVEDTYGELLSNEECFKIIKGWLMKQGNLTLASMLTTLRDMMGFAKFSETAAVSGLMGDVSKKDLAQLNRLLSRVKK